MDSVVLLLWAALGFFLGVSLGAVLVMLWDRFGPTRFLRMFRRTPPLADYVRLYKYEVWQDLGIPTKTFAITAKHIASGTITASRIANNVVTPERIKASTPSYFVTREEN